MSATKQGQILQTEAGVTAVYYTASRFGCTVHELLSLRHKLVPDLSGLHQYENEKSTVRRRPRLQRPPAPHQVFVSVWPDNREYWPPPANRSLPIPPLPSLPTKANATKYVECGLHGNVPVHPLIEIDTWREPAEVRGLNKYPHLRFWCSYVFTIDVLSPALIAAVYCVSRLLPQRWLTIIELAFGVNAGMTRLRNAAARFNHFFAPPTPAEFVEIVEIHREYIRPKEGDVERTLESFQILLDLCDPAVRYVFGGSKKNNAYRLTLAFPLLVASGLSMVELFTFLARTQTSPRRSCVRLALILSEVQLDHLTDERLGRIYKQFNDPPKKFELYGLAGTKNKNKNRQ